MHEKALRDRGKLSRELETQKKANTELRVQLGSAVPSIPPSWVAHYARQSRSSVTTRRHS